MLQRLTTTPLRDAAPPAAEGARVTAPPWQRRFTLALVLLLTASLLTACGGGGGGGGDDSDDAAGDGSPVVQAATAAETEADTAPVAEATATTAAPEPTNTATATTPPTATPAPTTTPTEVPPTATPKPTNTPTPISPTPTATPVPPTPTPLPPTPEPTPTMTVDEIKAQYRGDVDIREIDKAVERYVDWKMTYTGEVLTIQQSDTYTFLQVQVTYPGGSSYDRVTVVVIFFDGHAGDGIFEDDIVQFWGRPLMYFEGTNLYGGTIRQAQFTGDYIARQ